MAEDTPAAPLPETEAIIVVPQSQPALLPPRKKRRTFSAKRFVPTFVIKLDSGEKLEIPQDSSANKAAAQIMLAQIRKIFQQQLKKLAEEEQSGIVPRIDAATLKDLMTAVQKLTELSSEAYKEAGTSEEPTTAIGAMAASMVNAAAQGLAQGASNSLADRMRQIEQLGKKKIINITPAQAK